MVLPYTEEMAKQWLQTQPDIWKSQAAVTYGICWNPEQVNSQSQTDASPLLIGGIGLDICEEDEKGELGFWIDQSYWGKGVATEAAAALVKFGFEKLCLHKIVAFHMVRNPASGRVMEKLGMRKEGMLRDHVKKSDQFEDSVAYGILVSDV
jgi:RimJ/RimL family protein N-acetyltransferase